MTAAVFAVRGGAEWLYRQRDTAPIGVGFFDGQRAAWADAGRDGVRASPASWSIDRRGRPLLGREINADGSHATDPPITGALCCYSPGLSPDRTKLLFAGEGVVDASNADGTGATAI